MSTEKNKELFRRFNEDFFNKGNMSLADGLLAPDFVEREELPPGISRDRQGVKQVATMLRSAFPDFTSTIDDIIAEGDKLVVRATWRGTHKGEFMGISPIGKRVSFGVIDIIRFAGGKFAEHWGQMDSMSLMQQLGAIPAPALNRR
jgi:predicted ester cyclase